MEAFVPEHHPSQGYRDTRNHVAGSNAYVGHLRDWLVYRSAGSSGGLPQLVKRLKVGRRIEGVGGFSDDGAAPLQISSLLRAQNNGSEESSRALRFVYHRRSNCAIVEAQANDRAFDNM